jgi:rRNA processing protein Gar1
MRRRSVEGEAEASAFAVEADGDEEAKPTKTKRRSKADFDEAGLDDEAGGDTGPPRTLNEIDYVESIDLPLTVSPEAKIEPLGHILHIVEDTVVIKMTKPREALDLDSLLCFEDLRVLGRIFETFGPVDDPHYSVRITTKPPNASQHKNRGKKAANKTKPLNSPAPPTSEVLDAEPQPNHTTEQDNETIVKPEILEEDAKEEVKMDVSVETGPDALPEETIPMETTKEVAEKVLEEEKKEEEQKAKDEAAFFSARKKLLQSLLPNMAVFYVVEESRNVRPEQVYIKGYDASDVNDEELPPEQQEFSDDEAEREAAVQAKQRRKRAREERMASNMNEAGGMEPPTKKMSTAPKKNSYPSPTATGLPESAPGTTAQMVTPMMPFPFMTGSVINGSPTAATGGVTPGLVTAPSTGLPTSANAMQPSTAAPLGHMWHPMMGMMPYPPFYGDWNAANAATTSPVFPTMGLPAPNFAPPPSMTGAQPMGLPFAMPTNPMSHMMGFPYQPMQPNFHPPFYFPNPANPFPSPMTTPNAMDTTGSADSLANEDAGGRALRVKSTRPPNQ